MPYSYDSNLAPSDAVETLTASDRLAALLDSFKTGVSALLPGGVPIQTGFQGTGRALKTLGEVEKSMASGFYGSIPRAVGNAASAVYDKSKNLAESTMTPQAKAYVQSQNQNRPAPAAVQPDGAAAPDPSVPSVDLPARPSEGATDKTPQQTPLFDLLGVEQTSARDRLAALTLRHQAQGRIDQERGVAQQAELALAREKDQARQHRIQRAGLYDSASAMERAAREADHRAFRAGADIVTSGTASPEKNRRNASAATMKSYYIQEAGELRAGAVQARGQADTMSLEGPNPEELKILKDVVSERRRVLNETERRMPELIDAALGASQEERQVEERRMTRLERKDEDMRLSRAEKKEIANDVDQMTARELQLTQKELQKSIEYYTERSTDKSQPPEEIEFAKTQLARAKWQLERIQARIGKRGGGQENQAQPSAAGQADLEKQKAALRQKFDAAGEQYTEDELNALARQKLGM